MSAGAVHGLELLRGGYDTSTDVLVIGSGAGGAMAAANFAAAGRQVVVVEAGARLRSRDMSRDAPSFLARNYWEGGLRLIYGTGAIPQMTGRCLGGSTVVNSAIMLKMPDWVRAEWEAEEGIPWLRDGTLDRAYARVFERLKVAPTPMSVMGPKNLRTRDILSAAGVASAPLPRAVSGCQGCGDCITGCPQGAKQSVDLNLLPDAVRDGAQIFTCSEVDRLIFAGGRAVGAEGRVVCPDTHQTTGRFRVRAREVVLAGGVINTPGILLRSGVRKRVGDRFQMHLSCGAVAVLPDRVDPWVGATQGWGAISPDIRGLKYESLWAAPSLIMVKWGGLGQEWLQQLQDVKHACLVVAVYRGQTDGRVRLRLDGSPGAKLWIPDAEARTMLRGLHRVVGGMFAIGARRVTTSTSGPAAELDHPDQVDRLLDPRMRARDVDMTGNHIFGSVRMSARADRGPVDLDGRVRGVAGLSVMDGSLCPSPTAVNPQATIMAMADVLSRRMADLPA